MSMDMEPNIMVINIARKFVGNREGASVRTADEVREVFVLDAAHLLNVLEPTLPTALAMDECGEYPPDAAEELSVMCDEYEAKLNAAGYTVIWDDGFCIYKDLTDAEAEYLTR